MTRTVYDKHFIQILLATQLTEDALNLTQLGKLSTKMPVEDERGVGRQRLRLDRSIYCTGCRRATELPVYHSSSQRTTMFAMTLRCCGTLVRLSGTRIASDGGGFLKGQVRDYPLTLRDVCL